MNGHISTTKSKECPEPKNQGGVIGQPIYGFIIEIICIC